MLRLLKFLLTGQWTTPAPDPVCEVSGCTNNVYGHCQYNHCTSHCDVRCQCMKRLLATGL